MVSALIGGLIGAFAALGLAIWAYLVEERRRREDSDVTRTNLQNQYIVESSADLGERVRATLRQVDELQGVPSTLSWEAIYGPLRQLDGEMRSQSPRYRLAGVGRASDEIRNLLIGFLETRATVQGYLQADRDLVADVAALPPSEADSSTVRSLLGFTDTDLDRVTDDYKAASFNLLEERIEQILRAVAAYEPGPPIARSPLSVEHTSRPFEQASRVLDDWDREKTVRVKAARG